MMTAKVHAKSSGERVVVALEQRDLHFLFRQRQGLPDPA
jgi:hypothetical protein